MREDDLFARSAERTLTLGLRWSELTNEFDEPLDLEVTPDWSTRAAALLWRSLRDQVASAHPRSPYNFQRSRWQ